MNVDKTKPAWITPSCASHVDALRAAGAGHVIRIETIKTPTWRDAAKRIRPGDTIYIWVMASLPTRRGVDDYPPAVQPREMIREIEARGGVLVEVYTGRRSDNKAAKRGIIEDAERALRGKGRRALPAGYRSPGRRRREWTADEMRKAESVWRNVKKYPTWAFAAEHMPEGFTAARAHRLWGPRGAAPGRKK